MNFAVLRPKKKHLNFELKLGKSEEIQAKLENASLELLAYNNRYKSYNIQLSKKDVEGNKELLTELLEQAHNNF